MIVFDTDHLSVMAMLGPRAEQINRRRLRSPDQDFAITIVSIEEQMRGWLAEIHRRKISEQLIPYSRLNRLVSFWHQWEVLPFDEPAAVRFQSLKRQVN